MTPLGLLMLEGTPGSSWSTQSWVLRTMCWWLLKMRMETQQLLWGASAWSAAPWQSVS